MAEVIPFNGVLYNPQKVDAGSVMAPPYDIVTPEFKEILYKKSPYNIIRIDFGKDNAGDNEKENRYTRASNSLNEWLKQEILIKDTEPSFYCYEADYKINGQKKKLRGFLGIVKIEELASGKIHPHEMTYSKPRTDRLNIIRFCEANISPIFSLYSSPNRLTSSILEKLSEEKPFIEAKNGDNFIHRLWQISDKTSIETIKKDLSNKDIIIADGHHRYETALEFKNEMDKVRGQGSGRSDSARRLAPRVRGQDSEVKPWDYVMMFLVNMEDADLTVLPAHRLAEIKNKVQIKESLKPYFDITTIKFDDSTEKQAMQEMLSSIQNSKNSLGMLIKDEKAFCILNFKGALSEINSHESLKKLDVTILHKLVFEKLLGVDKFEYEMDPDLVVDKVKNSRHQTAFFLPPTKIHDVKEVALAGQRMPPKSTYFYPKLLTGMVIYKFHIY